jgi:hypothetical protein
MMLFQHLVVSIKMQDSSVNHLPLSATLCIKRGIPFMKIDDKEEKIGTKI